MELVIGKRLKQISPATTEVAMGDPGNLLPGSSGIHYLMDEYDTEMYCDISDRGMAHDTTWFDHRRLMSEIVAGVALSVVELETIFGGDHGD